MRARIYTISTLMLALGLLFTTSAVNAQEIQWMSWNEAVAQWQKDMEAYNAEPDKDKKVPPKKFFIDVYTSWCGWCKKMDASTFKDPNIVQYMNQKYYAIKLDAEMSEAVDFNGHTFVNPSPGQRRSTHQLASSLLDNHLSYPSYVILDENTHRITIYKGYKQAMDMFGILTFFGSNQYLTYKEYLSKQPKAAEPNN